MTAQLQLMEKAVLRESWTRDGSEGQGGRGGVFEKQSEEGSHSEGCVR